MDEFEDEADRRMNGCDRCGPYVKALIHVIIGDGELKLCGHCATKYRARLNALGGFLYELFA